MGHALLLMLKSDCSQDLEIGHGRILYLSILLKNQMLHFNSCTLPSRKYDILFHQLLYYFKCYELFAK